MQPSMAFTLGRCFVGFENVFQRTVIRSTFGQFQVQACQLDASVGFQGIEVFAQLTVLFDAGQRVGKIA